MKKRICISVFFIAGISLFANTSTVLSKVAELNFRAMDIPLLDGMAYFIHTTGRFYKMAQVLAFVIFLAALVWNAFRLWFGTQTVQKASVDIMFKALLFTTVFALYSSIRVGVLDTAMQVGAKAGGGANLLSMQFSNLTLAMEEKIKLSTNAIKKLIQNGAGNGAVLSRTDINKLASRAGMTDEQMKKFVEDNDYTVKENVSGKKLFIAGALTGSPVTTIVAAAVGAKNVINYNKMYKNMSEAEKEAINKSIDNGEVANAYRLMNALSEVLVENPEWQKQTAKGETPTMETSITKYLYSPYISVDKKDANAQKLKNQSWAKTGVNESILISPGQMIKTGVLIANILKVFGESEYNNNIGKVEKKHIIPTWHEIFEFILLTTITLAVVFSCIFCVIQYVMCIFEYFITTSVGVIFIPFILWDGTKSFAAKLVTLFTAYFIKITVMLMCLFWTYAAYINMGMVILSSAEPLSLLNFAYCMFVIILGFVCTQNAPQIAVAALNGSPQLSMGEFLHAAGTAAAGAALAAKASGSAIKNTAVGVGTGAIAGVAAGIGAYQGTPGEKIAPKFVSAFKSGAKAAASQWTMDGINAISRATINRDVMGNSKDSKLYGRGNDKDNFRSDGKAGYADITKHYRKQAKDLAKEQAKAKENAKNAPHNDGDKKVDETGAQTRSGSENLK